MNGGASMTRPQLAALCVLWLHRQRSVTDRSTFEVGYGMYRLFQRQGRLADALIEQKLVVDGKLAPKALATIEVLSALGVVKKLADSIVLGGVR